MGVPAEELDRVVTPFLLPDGHLAVPLEAFGEIRIFDAGGKHLSTVGREGEGPGEFRSLQAAWARGDTIEAFDDRLLRITRFPPGGPAEVIPIELIPSAQAAVPGSPSYGWVVMGVADAGMGRRDQVALHRFSRDGSYLGEVGRFEGMARYRTPVFSGPDPLSPKTVFVVSGDRIYAGETLTPSMRVIGPDGSAEREITWIPAAEVSPAAAYQAVVEAAVAQARPNEAQQTRLRLESFPKTDRVSVFWGAQVDANGFLWIRPFDPLRHSLELGGYSSTGPGGTWLVVAPDGSAVSAVTVPAQLEPAMITSSDMVGIRRDELGVE
ncbi:MAG: NHL repeat-containing protein [Longimicrobiales bacterium]